MPPKSTPTRAIRIEKHVFASIRIDVNTYCRGKKAQKKTGSAAAAQDLSGFYHYIICNSKCSGVQLAVEQTVISATLRRIRAAGGKQKRERPKEAFPFPADRLFAGPSRTRTLDRPVMSREL